MDGKNLQNTSENGLKKTQEESDIISSDLQQKIIADQKLLIQMLQERINQEKELIQILQRRQLLQKCPQVGSGQPVTLQFSAPSGINIVHQ